MFQGLKVLFSYALTAAIASSQSAMAQPVGPQELIASEAPRWCDFANEYLTLGRWRSVRLSCQGPAVHSNEQLLMHQELLCKAI